MERKVANIWQDLFGLSRVRADQDFFKLGGNSLMVIQLITRLRQTVGADVPIQTVFEHPTVEGLAREVSLLLMDPEELAELERMLQAIESLGMEMD